MEYSVVMSHTIGELAKALAAAQAELAPAVKDSTNPHLGSHYADLTSVWEACRKALPKHGLAVVQPGEKVQGGVLIRTVLMHISGEWVEGETFVPVPDGVKNPAQAYGSAITYARRYGLAALVGVTAEDSDGADLQAPERRYEAGPQGERRAPTQGGSPKPKSPVSRVIEAMLTPSAQFLRDRWQDYYGSPMPRAKDMTEAELTEVLSWIDEVSPGGGQ